ncbi:MAG: hypothetical protein KAS32_09105 [Candidatus Peribacteraceae bacterium]|nr:hypothetical protein [Candidatus Peribacteraceae bacterium]
MFDLSNIIQSLDINILNRTARYKWGSGGNDYETVKVPQIWFDQELNHKEGMYEQTKYYIAMYIRFRYIAPLEPNLLNQIDISGIGEMDDNRNNRVTV